MDDSNRTVDSGKEENKNKKRVLDLNNSPPRKRSGELGFQDSVPYGGAAVADEGRSGDSSSSKLTRTRYSAEEKGKSKMDNDLDLDLDLNLGLGRFGKVAIQERINSNNGNSMGSNSNSSIGGLKEKEKGKDEMVGLELSLSFGRYGREPIREPINRESSESRGFQQRVMRELRRRRFPYTRIQAEGLARDKPKGGKTEKEETEKKKKRGEEEEVDEVSGDPQSPFLLAMKAIKSRNLSQKGGFPGGLPPRALWVPVTRKEHVAKRNAPKLVDLCLDVLAKNADAIVSLELVPDELRHRLSEMVSDLRGIDSHFLGLLSRGCPTEIRVKDISSLLEEAFTRVFGDCDTQHLTVLQLDLCGKCVTDYMLHQTLASSSNRLPALTTISLKGAIRMSDDGLTALTSSAPALQSINLSECSLLTSDGINRLVCCFQSTLRELYIDDCQNIDAMFILPALKELRCLEVLSVAGIETVNDDFVIGIIEACGTSIKELVFAQCMKLTDMSLKIVGGKCPKLCALDLSNLKNLTDMSLYYLANGCRSIRRFKLCHNRFSDEAIAAFLESSGGSLNILSLNSVYKVGLNTALAIAKCSTNLFHLDCSWCRKLTDEALGPIVDSCVSLKLLKIFGCTQITNDFMNGHTNTVVRIIGNKTTRILDNIRVPQPQEGPLQ